MGSEKGRKTTRNDPTQTKTDNNNHNNIINAPSTPIESLARRTAYTRAAATTSKARRRTGKNEIPLSSSSSAIRSSLKPRRVRGALRDWDSQITLTQIVSQAESPSADADLLQGDENDDENVPPKRGGVEIIDLVNESEEEDDDSVPRTKSRQKSTLKKNRTRLSPNHIPTTTFKSRKSVGFDSSAKKNTGFGKGKNEKFSKKGKDGNKTLTQMDFVRRYIPLPESDDDLKFYEDSSLPTRKSPSKAPVYNTKEAEEHMNEFPTPRKKRKLSNEPANPMHPAPATTLPKTPQKTRKFEIPSSQTPETPRQEILPPADVHNVSRLPLEAFSTKPSKTSSDQPPKELSQAKARPSFPSNYTVPETAENSVSENNSNGPNAGSLGQSTASAFDSDLPPVADEIQQPSELPDLPPSSFSKTVVYGTDDETEYSDFEADRLLDSPRPNERTPKAKGSGNVEEDNSIPNSDDSNDLPPHVPNSGTDLDINYNTFSDTALPSDASLYYRRPAQYTQYPTEPVPMLNSQKMAELFPIDENGDPPSTPKAPPLLDKERAMRLKNDHSDILCSQTQSDEAEKSTQMVPESSPITRKHEEETDDVMMPPPREPPVVLVESSQLVDRINRQNSSSLDTGPALPRLLSAKDFLTDSVMESIPPPPWVLSQDSVGEPYPEESRKRGT